VASHASPYQNGSKWQLAEEFHQFPHFPQFPSVVSPFSAMTQNATNYQKLIGFTLSLSPEPRQNLLGQRRTERLVRTCAVFE